MMAMLQQTLLFLLFIHVWVDAYDMDEDMVRNEAEGEKIKTAADEFMADSDIPQSTKVSDQPKLDDK